MAEVSADSSQEAKRLAATPLMPAPAPGTERFLRMREVQDLLAAHGENLDQLQFKGEVTVAVGSPDGGDNSTDDTTNNQTDSAHLAAWASGKSSNTSMVAATPTATRDVNKTRNELNQRVADYLAHASGQSAALQVKCDVPSEQLALLPADSATWKLSGGSEPWTGKQRILISFAGPQGDDSFTASVDVLLPVAVAIRPLDRGAVVTAADVELQPQDPGLQSQNRSVPFTTIDSLVGMETKRAIQVGDMITTDAVQPPVLVKRGDAVSVYARGGGIQVRTIARARENGSLGQPVQVESLDTHKTYDAVITGMR
ncbi:MAG TPA: flagellar basal body P-ring formation chaperone FlgA, partial [Planctomycetaceae bacterium]